MFSDYLQTCFPQEVTNHNNYLPVLNCSTNLFHGIPPLVCFLCQCFIARLLIFLYKSIEIIHRFVAGDDGDIRFVFYFVELGLIGPGRRKGNQQFAFDQAFIIFVFRRPIIEILILNFIDIREQERLQNAQLKGRSPSSGSV